MAEMKNKVHLKLTIILLFICFALTSCLPMRVVQVSEGTKGTKSEYSPLMYQERPISIMVLPLVDSSLDKMNFAQTRKYFGETVADCLRKHGYYVLPGEISFLTKEKILDAEHLLKFPAQKIKTDYNADAVLYTIIEKWDRYYGLGYKIQGAILFVLKSTKTDQVLWKQGIIVRKGSVSGGGNIGALIINRVLVVVQEEAGSSHYMPSAAEIGETMNLALESMPFGKFHELYEKDMDYPLTHQNREDEEGKLQKALKIVNDFIKSVMDKIEVQKK